MKYLKSWLVIGLSGLALVGCVAQQEEVVDPKMDENPAYQRMQGDAPRLKAPQIPAVRVELAPTVKPVAHALEDSLDRLMSEEIGYVLPVAQGEIPTIPWHDLPDGGKVAKLELHSANAAGLRVQFFGFLPSPGFEVRVYKPNKPSVVRGPYTSPRLSEDLTWWSPHIFSDSIGFEFYLSPEAKMPRQMPVINQIGYLFCDGLSCHDGFPPGTPFTCHNDISCNASWKNNDGRGSACIYFTSGGSCSRCSGALINRGPGDFSPLFTTANHCISTQSAANSVEVFWLYETASCNGAAPDIDDAPRTDGALLLKRNPDSDFTLLGLYEPPATNFYIGSDPNNWPSGDDATGVHHPRGSFKRISFGTSDGSSDDVGFDADGDGDADIFVDVWDVDYTSGTTQPGSSGSPIHDGARRMRGVLTGGTSGCAPITARYGRYDLAYARVRYFIGNSDIASPVYVDNSVAGDPGQSGSSERGTSGNPFNTVYEATFAVRSNDTVQIDPGTYVETFRLWRPMTLQRKAGTSGVVRIGG